MKSLFLLQLSTFSAMFFVLALVGLLLGLFGLWRTVSKLTAELAESKKSEILLRTMIDSTPDLLSTIDQHRSHLDRIEENLQKKDRLLQAVVKATYELISNSRLDEAVGKVIVLLGSAMQLDKVNIYCHVGETTGKAVIDQLASWDADSDTVEYRREALQHIPAVLTPFSIGVLSRNEIYIRAVNKIEDPVLRSLLERRKVKALAVFPIFAAGRFWGFVSFNDCHEERDWTATELSILQSFAVTLGVVIERKESGNDANQVTPSATS